MSPVTLGQKMGAGIFIVLVVSCWAFFNITLSSKETGKEYHVFFNESVRGLAPSSLVCYNGIPVGKVTKLTNDLSKNRVKVDVIITEPDIKIFMHHKGKENELEVGTKAKLVTYMMTGLQYIDLDGIGVEELPEESTIPTTEDNMMKRIEDQFSSISEQARNITVRLDKIVSSENLEHLNNIISNMDTISKNIAILTSPDDVDGPIYRLNMVLTNMEKLSGEGSKLETILDNIVALSDPKKLGLDILIKDARLEMKKLSKSMNIVLYNANGLLDSKGKKEDLTKTIDEVNVLLRENRQNISQIMENLKKLSHTTDVKLQEVADSAKKTVETFNHFLQKELYQTSSKMNLLLTELTNVIQILKAKPNALLWGSEVKRK